MAYKRISPQPVVEGGTGAQTLTGVCIGNGTSAITGNTVTQYDVLVGGASNAISSVGPGTSLQVLQSGGNAANPAYSTATYPATVTASELLYASSSNVVGQVTLGDYGVLISNSTGVPSWLANGTTGQVLTATTSGNPSWAAASGSTPAITLIATKTASTSSSISWTSGISGTFNQYMIIYQGSIASVSGSMDIQVSTNGGLSYTATGYVNSVADTTGLALYQEGGTGISTGIVSGVMYIFNLTSGSGYISSNNRSAVFVSGGSPSATSYATAAGFLNSSGVSGVNAIQLIASAGTFTGAFSLYSIQS